MSTYYARYLTGDCDNVWRDLVSHGTDLKDVSLYSDALSVARELVDRAYRNLAQLLSRLTNIGYVFQNKDSALVEGSTNEQVVLDTVEEHFGVLPLVVREWYKRIRSVDFSQEASQLFGQPSSIRLPVSGLGLNTPLVVLSIPKCLELKEQLSRDAAIDPISSKTFTQFLPTGGWASNSDPKGFSLPCNAFDGVIYNDGAGDVHFVQELRTAFRWGGFPFWRRLLTGRKLAQPLKFVPEFEKLLPTLTEGLIPI